MWTLDFWKDTAERAVKTFAQAVVALLTAGATTILDVDWTQAASVGGLAALVSVLTSIASTGIGDHHTAAALRGHVGRHRRPE